MFWKKRKKEKVKYDVASENLAVPEVHTGEVEQTETDPQPDEPITYENVAIPEIHIRRKK